LRGVDWVAGEKGWEGVGHRGEVTLLTPCLNSGPDD